MYYLKYYKYIDSLSKKFNILSRKFLANYYDTNIANQNENITYLFDFSRFFQKYLIYREKGNKFINGIKLLFNDPQYIEYEKVGMIKEKEEKFLEKDIVNLHIDKFKESAIKIQKEANDIYCQYIEEKPLEDLIDVNNIHGWLQDRIHRAEGRMAAWTKVILENNQDYILDMRKVYENQGVNAANEAKESLENINAETIFNSMNDYILDGMPCDRVNEVISVPPLVVPSVYNPSVDVTVDVPP